MTLAPDGSLAPRYGASHALVIGIDVYEAASPLGYAVNDARAVATLLTGTFGFPSDNVHLLLDGEATRDAIRRRFFGFAGDGTDVNDRLVIFFGGHGQTERSRRADIGFLVAHDSNPRDLASLVRWDDLTRGADLIRAKHVLFLMDACYGGLAVTRSLQPGSMRFLKDMLLRSARQVLTAGKADEVVADLGGPLPNHSVFTGHLLEALDGGAADKEGVITANGVMAYVYQKVGRDSSSHQTPHFGYLDGDGDFIFFAPQLKELQENQKADADLLVSIPAVLQEGQEQQMTVVNEIKDLLSEERHRIRLHDVVSVEIRRVLSLTAADHFPAGGQWSNIEFLERIARYEEVTARLRDVEALLCRWGANDHAETLALAPRQLAGRLRPESGMTAWIALRWYPVLLLLYSGGIAAVGGRQFGNLRALLQARVGDPESFRQVTSLALAVVSGLAEAREAFQTLPGHERNYTPLSEYLFKLLQPALDDLLFVGADYEGYFDTFEVLLALVHADEYSRLRGGRVWGPIGRFGWKFTRGVDGSPFHRLVAEAEAEGDAWLPLQAGLFPSRQRFKEIAAEYAEGLRTLGWF